MLRIYDTLTRRKRRFYPLNRDRVTMYNCGLTVYDRAHIGNLRAYTMADIIRRTLEFLGYGVIQVQNFTDVGHETFTDEQKAKIQGSIEITDTDAGIDRIEKTARKTGMSPWEVAETYIDFALKDFREMNYLEPHYRPRASQHIPEQIELIKALLEKGYAYITDSAIYYDISKFEKYWDFTKQRPEDKKNAVRAELEIDPQKKNPSDFRLWQYNRPDHIMQWDFWWEGKNYRGYPGWHIECSAMAHKYLGHPIDIHTGGADHIAVHHPNEVAQSEPIYGEPFVRYWYHNEFLTVDGKRMGKSLGNAYNLDDIKAHGFEALDLRYFYFTADFRRTQNFSWSSLEAASNSRKKILSQVDAFRQNQNNKAENPTIAKNYEDKFREALEDSFNMPRALAVLWDVINDDQISNSQKLDLIKRFDHVFGLRLLEDSGEQIIDQEIKKELEELIIKRNEARIKKDFATADAIRKQIGEMGFEVYDTPEGTKLKKIEK